MKHTKRVKSPDNWHPSFDDGTVEVNLHYYKQEGRKKWRLSVWGDDDFGMEIDDLDINKAFEIFRKIDDGITQKRLKEIGFVLA